MFGVTASSQLCEAVLETWRRLCTKVGRELVHVTSPSPVESAATVVTSTCTNCGCLLFALFRPFDQILQFSLLCVKL